MTPRASIIDWLKVCSLVLAAHAHADDITLAGNNRLSGAVRSLDPLGVVELASALSPQPILLKAAGVQKVVFSATKEPLQPASALLELTNGDLLPAAIDGANERSLTATTADAGQLVVPRTALKALQLGIHRPQVFYSGPTNLEEWLGRGDDPSAWRFENNGLLTSGEAQVSRQIEVPQQFLLKFTLKWSDKPNFQINFADDLKPGKEARDRYCFAFNSGGMELKREASQGNRFTPVIFSNRKPEDFPDKSIDFEIRVDRKNSRLELRLNGDFEARGIDPLPRPPLGNGFTFISHATDEDQEIRAVEIANFDDARLRSRVGEPSDTKSDWLISRDQEAWAGSLTGLRKTAEGLVLIFKSDAQPQPLEFSEHEVMTLFFAQAEAGVVAGPAQQEHPFGLRLRENGLLRVSACSFSEAAVAVVHPLLGAISIQRSGVTAMERLAAINQEGPQP